MAAAAGGTSGLPTVVARDRLGRGGLVTAITAAAAAIIVGAGGLLPGRGGLLSGAGVAPSWKEGRRTGRGGTMVVPASGRLVVGRGGGTCPASGGVA